MTQSGANQQTGGNSGNQKTCPRCKTVYPVSAPRCPKCGATKVGESGHGPGDILDGKYEIMALLGVGGMGEVFKARHVNLHALRTIKVMRKALTQDETFRGRFLREARLATQVHHPNIAVVHDFATLEDGTYYMVSEFIDGFTLRQWANKNGRFSVALAADVLIQVLDGLDHIHRRGMLHRDISADNIMITHDPDGRPVGKIIDLGIAKMLDAPTGEGTMAGTQVGMFIGNPRYSSPEQMGHLPAGEEIDARADLYCLGVVLYEMVAGVPPFVADTPAAYMMKHLTQAPPPLPSSLNLPPEFMAIVMKALEKDRNKRWDSAKAFARALKPFRTKIQEETSSGTLLSDVTAAPITGTFTSRTTTGTSAGETQYAKDADREAWEAASRVGTVEAYQTYMREHPSGRHTADALGKLHELATLDQIRQLESSSDLRELQTLASSNTLSANLQTAARTAQERVAQRMGDQERDENSLWDTAIATGSYNAWNAFLQRFPGSARRSDAERLRDEARAFELARDAATIEGWQSYLGTWPSGVHAQMGRHAIDQLRAQQEDNDFEIAEKQGRAGWEWFLNRHPGARKAAEARAQLARLVEEEEFARANEKKSLTGWRTFLAAHPDSPHAAEARRNEARAALEAAVRDDRVDAYRKFIETYGWSEEKERASQMLEELVAFEESCTLDSEAGWNGYLSRFPEGRHAGPAKERLALHQQQRRATIERVLDKGTRTALQAYLSENPAAASDEAIRSFESELRAFEKAEAAGSSDAWRDFLSYHPASRKSADARARLDMALEDEAFGRAVQLGDASGYSNYLREYPTGRFATLAVSRLKALEGGQPGTVAMGAPAVPPADATVAMPYPTADPGATVVEPMMMMEDTGATVVEPMAMPMADVGATVVQSMPMADAGATVVQPMAMPSGDAGATVVQPMAMPAGDAGATVVQPMVMPPGDAGATVVQPMAMPGSDAAATVMEPMIAKPAQPAPQGPTTAEKRAKKKGSPPPKAQVAPTMMEAPTPAAPPAPVPVPAPAPAPAPAVAKTTTEVPVKEGRSLGLPIGIGVAVIAVIAVIAWFVMGRGPSTDTTTTSTETATAAATNEGTLVIDALPWGRVVSVTDESGKTFGGAGEEFTPTSLSLPPGHYKVKIAPPGEGKREVELEADVKTGEIARVQGVFDAPSAKEYLESVGW